MESLKNKNTEFKIKIQKRNLESYFFLIFLSSKLLSFYFFLSMVIIPDQIKQSRKLKYRRNLRVQLLRKYPTLKSKCALRRLRKMNPAVVLLRRKLNSLKRDCFNIRALSQSLELLFWISCNPEPQISIFTFNLRVENYKNYTFPYLYFSYSYPSKSSFQPITWTMRGIE